MKNLFKQKEKIALFLFYLAYGIELGIMLVDKSALTNPFEGRLFQLTFLLCVIKILMTKYSYKEWGLIVAFGLVGMISYFSTGRNEIVRIVMFVAASKGIDNKKLIKYTFYITLAGVLLLMTLSAFGVLGWNYVEADFDGDGPEGVMRRYCFGLGHPNAFHCMFWSIMLLAIHVYFKKIKWHDYLLMIILNIILFYFTDSKTGFIITSGSIFLAIVMKYSNKIRNQSIIYIMGIFSIIVGVVFSILNATYGANDFNSETNNIFSYLDKYLTGRLWIAKNLAGIEKWSLFSNSLCTEYFDMGYNRMFYWYGIIPGVIYLFTICLFIWHCYKKKYYSTFIIIVMFGIYNIVEAHAISVYIVRNYIILLLFGCWNEVFHVCGNKERYFYQILNIHDKSKGEHA